jgi:ParB family transcriptional regulator, chromosome partitioning protein
MATSWMKQHAERAKGITVTPDDQRKALDTPKTEARTAPGHLMQLQATVERQRHEIAALKAQKGSRAKRPISRMHEVEGRRRKLTPEQYAELKANLAKYPLAYPVVLEERPDGDWDINAGNNRISIYRELGIEEIDSIVTDVDPELAEMVSFWSNLFAPSLSDYEKYVNFQRLQEGGDALTRQELAAAAGLSEAHVSRIFSFDGLPAEAKQILVDRPERLGAEAATQLARATAEGRGEQVVEAVRRLVTDDNFLQKDAVKAVEPVKAKATVSAQPLTVKIGRKSYCEITTRNGVIGVKLKAETERADEWANEIRRFIEAKLNERSE